MRTLANLRRAIGEHHDRTGRRPTRINAGKALLDELSALCRFPTSAAEKPEGGAWGEFEGIPLYRGVMLEGDFELVPDEPIEQLKDRLLETLAQRPGGAN